MRKCRLIFLDLPPLQHPPCGCWGLTDCSSYFVSVAAASLCNCGMTRLLIWELHPLLFDFKKKQLKTVVTSWPICFVILIVFCSALVYLLTYLKDPDWSCYTPLQTKASERRSKNKIWYTTAPWEDQNTPRRAADDILPCYKLGVTASSPARSGEPFMRAAGRDFADAKTLSSSKKSWYHF